MKPFTTVMSRLVPLPAANVDTDQIIPAQLVNVQGRVALASALFANLRNEDPGFVLNDPSLQGRSVLLVGPNFGCGSSREAAAWALEAAGFRALIGTSFNETFWSNCTKNGILPLTVSADVYAGICDAVARAPDCEVTINLPAGRVVLADAGIEFTVRIDPFVRDLMIRGIDELDYLLDRRDLIDRHELERAAVGDRPAAE
jgi:3-isopropylmalate/(R)-2-methylmalate dehydratase small subunit